MLDLIEKEGPYRGKLLRCALIRIKDPTIIYSSGYERRSEYYIVIRGGISEGGKTIYNNELISYELYYTIIDYSNK